MSSTLYIGRSVEKAESVCAAHRLSPPQRQALAISVLEGSASVSALSRDQGVSRKFLYQQAHKAQGALEEAFAPSPEDGEVLFWLPVTKAWLRQLVLALVLICHASFRGVVELFGDLLDTKLSVGSVHNIVHQAVVGARAVNAKEDLSGIEVGAHDEIFQNGRPVLVGCDVASTYCYLLAPEEARDRTTWGVHLLELDARGLHPSYTLADFGKGLRAGQADAWPEVSCRGDHFHVLREMTRMVTYLENRALSAISKKEQLEKKMIAAKKQHNGQRFSKRLAQARQAEIKAIELAEDVATLVGWMRHDILAVVGPIYPIRDQLYDFVLEELQARQSQASHRIRPIVRTLQNGREDLLAFAQEVDTRLEHLASETQVAPHRIRALFDLHGHPYTDPQRGHTETALRRQLGHAFYPLQQAIVQIIADTRRASSVVENLNSRLRAYFFLRKQLGNDYLDLLRFFLNHRRFLRSECPERVGKSPKEILTGNTHPHWLSLLGFQPFKRVA
jgi:hypothetical protein